MEPNDFYPFRTALVNSLQRDIIGPSHPEEVLDDAPITQYLSGILYPQGVLIEGDQDETDEVEGNDSGEPSDPAVALANIRYPSSMGLTFSVDGDYGGELLVKTSAGRYSQVESPIKGIPETRAPRSEKKWQRSQVEIPEVRLSTEASSGRKELSEGLILYYRVRKSSLDRGLSVTLVLINSLRSDVSELKDPLSFFQVSLEVRSPESRPIFVERRQAFPGVGDDELKSYDLLYRDARVFAVGHGCAADWDVAESDDTRAVQVRTTYLPERRVLVSESNPQIDTSTLNFTLLGFGEKGDVAQGLVGLADGYLTWIEQTMTSSQLSLEGDRLKTALLHIDACREAEARIRNGIAILERDDNAFLAFQLANQAMLQQRARSEWLKDTSGDAIGPDITSGHAWRPFQIAFILQCLAGIVDPNSRERQYADLLWFPTGGGKTEAYLGLIAFTIFYRRLRSLNAAGVTALMRYTLRLLTIQQFHRATLLICCCEEIRRSRTDLGNTEISIGLWVGGDATPNARSDARKAIDDARRGVTPTTGNPMQLQACPWCGSPLDAYKHTLLTTPPRLKIACGQTECAFGSGLPVFVVDEDIYDFRPSLLIATVDKFASLPRSEDRAELFNIDSGLSARRKDDPPELIVQDELHLISGPLGTLVGLYETAVDLLASKDGIAPKIIASTATIRRAGEQARALFRRDVRQFPPSGVNAADSYFAVEASSASRGDRLYVGLLAPGMSQATLLVRTYAALLQNAFELKAPDAIKDPYWTLVGYFNSLRVLGGARMQVQDDVDDRMGLLAARSAATKRTEELSLIELTSREPSAHIPAHLRQMAKPLPDTEVLDVILATNMISVGVDIDRLGLMVESPRV